MYKYILFNSYPPKENEHSPPRSEHRSYSQQGTWHVKLYKPDVAEARFGIDYSEGAEDLAVVRKSKIKMEDG